MALSELQEHKEVARYLKRAHPGLIFRTDYGAGLKLTVGQAKTQKALQESDSYPDIFLAEPTAKYHGLFLEMKTADTKLIRSKNATKILKGETTLRVKGDLWDKHIEKQFKMHQRLRAKGYAVTFARGHEEAKRFIEEYLLGMKVMPVIDADPKPPKEDDNQPF